MNYVDAFREPRAGQALVRRLQEAVAERQVTVMEVCGTHTAAVFRFGLRTLLPPNLKLLSGPGCPVCVTPTRYVDQAVALAERSEFILATFGDMVRVPGSRTTLEHCRAAGAAVRVVYSPREAVALAAESPERNVVFLAVGFETTAPTIAAAILQAERQNRTNFFVLPGNKTMPAALAALATADDLSLDGFLCPGHVSVITGARIYEFLACDHGLPCVVSGFEPLDILYSLDLVVRRVAAGTPGVDIQYSRAVTWEGNVRAQELMEQVFVAVDSEWRGLGVIPGSGLALAPAFQRFDAATRFPVDIEPSRDPPGCLCGGVLRGARTPADCPLFGVRCTPATPVGPCMVSGEGTCAAWFRYAVHRREVMSAGR